MKTRLFFGGQQWKQLLFLLLVVVIAFNSCDMLDIHERQARFSINATYPCEDGLAAREYKCNNIDLVAHLSPQKLGGDQLNDIWGWTDPATNKRYALVGVNTGVSIVDITVPSAPIVLGLLPSHTSHDDHSHNSARSKSSIPSGPSGNSIQHSSLWGDMKVYKNYMYAVSEEEGHGVHVFDLTRLRKLNTTVDSFSVDYVYDELGTAHNINVNTESGYAYAVGTRGDTCSSRGLHMINLENPAQPQFAGCYDETGDIHDTQCVIYKGPDADYQGRELCFNSNADKFSIVDVTDKENPDLVSILKYEGLGYVHQGWLTEDQRYFLVGDEFDERQSDHNLRTYILDVTDLDNPSLKNYYEADVPSIDHNLFVKGNHVYQSNYTSGIFILSLDNIAKGKLERVAYFDTYPANNKPIFKGTWSNYPFFDNGIVIASDITGGLFILHPHL